MCPFLISAKKPVNEKGDTLYYQITPFQFTDQEGQPFSSEQAKGKILVVNYFFASCKDVCPRMNALIAEIYPTFKDVESVQFASITVDPENDNPSRTESLCSEVWSRQQKLEVFNRP
jgi:protein SCO1/2